MPTYEYVCLSCKHAFERLQSMTDKPVKKCPECGKKVQRLMGAGTGVVFKGSGFYETDYKRKGGGSAPNSSSGSNPAKPGASGASPKS